jgi:hypothetical protein
LLATLLAVPVVAAATPVATVRVGSTIARRPEPAVGPGAAVLVGTAVFAGYGPWHRGTVGFTATLTRLMFGRLAVTAEPIRPVRPRRLRSLQLDMLPSERLARPVLVVVALQRLLLVGARVALGRVVALVARQRRRRRHRTAVPAIPAVALALP